VNFLQAGQIFVGDPPAGRGLPRRPATCTIVFLIAVAIFIVVEGQIIWTVIRYRQAGRRPPAATISPSPCGRSS
jgi:heme/copper-type cytochrome/quinol oxidase subunit 2